MNNQQFAERLADKLSTPDRVRPWRALGRPEQFPPPDPWNIWLILAGRGAGKTFTGAGWLIEQAANTPGSHWAVFAPTFSDCKRICVEGPSGLLVAALPGEIVNYNKTLGELDLVNGSKIYMVSADEPDRARGYNLHGAWVEEAGSWRRPETWYEGLVPAVRIGIAKIVVTTTPRPTKLVKDLVGRKDGTVAITRGSTFDNIANLSAVAVAELKRRYEGTRLGRQELYGELLEDVEGALWTRELIKYWPGDTPKPAFERVVVAMDPSVTNNEDSDECGVVAAGRTKDGKYVVLQDRSDRLAPIEQIKRAISTYYWNDADRIIGEVNNGGDWIENLLRTVDPEVPYSQVRASRGKQTRAEPIAALYEQNRVYHAAVFTDLEDQLCTWAPGVADSPDRLDALVWALTELSSGVEGARITFAGKVKHKQDQKVPHAADPEAKVISHDMFVPAPGGWS